MAERGARLLVVDDNKVNRLLLMRSVELLGHRVASAENGRMALELLRAEPFDLVLLDMEMPEMDGFQVLEHMVTDADLRDVPVIVTSSLEGLAHVVRCIELGADDYLHKPVIPVLLKARIGSSLEKKRLRDQQRDMVRRFATSEVAQDLQQSGFALGGRRIHAAAMFSDIRGFTSIAESQTPEDTIELLNSYYSLMFEAISRHGGVVNQMIGDGLMAIFGAPLPLQEPSLSAVRAALDMQEMITLLNVERCRVRQAGDPHRDRHRNRRYGGGLHRNAPARHVHLHRRHGEPGVAPGSPHQGNRSWDRDRWRHSRGAGQPDRAGEVRTGHLQGQVGSLRRVRRLAGLFTDGLFLPNKA